MRKRVLIILLALGLGTTAGCSIRTTGFNTESLTNRPGISLIDPNNGPYSIKVMSRNDGGLDYFWEIDSQIEQARPCRVKYHRLYSTRGFMVVEGRVGEGGRMYPVVLDTGASQSIFVKDTHVLDNKLPIYPMQTGKAGLNGFDLGLCYLPELQIGNMALVDWPCLYLERHAKPELFGLSIAHDDIKDDTIIVGLPVLQEFKYVLFDNVGKEAEFSYNEPFEPGETRLWERYPLSIEEDFRGNAFLFVSIPMCGEEIELQLDTGSGRGLAVREELWEKMSEKIRNVNLKNGRDLYPYIGLLPCERGIIREFEMGERVVKNLEISVFPNDSPLVKGCRGLLGVQCFQDTVMVLDFENKLMWIKNPQR
ncbi:MAG: hypothetical protein PHQ35_06590 [Phycisphaerae bacterium]|nr:hypothetical protein [Phycisphaerae bacterium]MDD5381153.1 hypothetical protein [Phycisphaerae bacterium]